jgi:hypothetical protein
LNSNGVTLNDANDADAGPNNLQNFPVINSAVSYNNALLTATGTIRTTPNTFLFIDLYWSPTADSSGYGEGANYLGATAVTTDANGFATFAVQYNASVPNGAVVSATATTASGNTSEFSAVRSVTPSSPGAAIWVQSGNTPEQSFWNGTSFGPVSNTSNVGGVLRVIQGAEGPTRDEMIVFGLDRFNAIRGEMWNGSTWTALPFNPAATLSTNNRWAGAVAYESQSGDAIVVWANGSTGTDNLSYRVWNGSSWSAEQTITAPINAEVYQLRIASNPNRDEMVLVVATNGPEEFALVWNGSSWGNSILLDNSSAGGQQTEIYATYESLSGDALIVYDADAPGNTLQYRTWNGTA